jgi:hypothetical protein
MIDNEILKQNDEFANYLQEMKVQKVPLDLLMQRAMVSSLAKALVHWSLKNTNMLKRAALKFIVK